MGDFLSYDSKPKSVIEQINTTLRKYKFLHSKNYYKQNEKTNDRLGKYISTSITKGYIKGSHKSNSKTTYPKEKKVGKNTNRQFIEKEIKNERNANKLHIEISFFYLSDRPRPKWFNAYLLASVLGTRTLMHGEWVLVKPLSSITMSIEAASMHTL